MRQKTESSSIVIFNCDYCNKENSRVKRVYDRFTKHYCDNICSAKAIKHSRANSSICYKCKDTLDKDDLYEYTTDSFGARCRTCRDKEKAIRLTKQKMRRNKFIKKWNRVILSQ